MGRGFYQHTLLWQIKKSERKHCFFHSFFILCSFIRSKGSNYWDALQLIESLYFSNTLNSAPVAKS